MEIGDDCSEALRIQMFEGISLQSSLKLVRVGGFVVLLVLLFPGERAYAQAAGADEMRPWSNPFSGYAGFAGKNQDNHRDPTKSQRKKSQYSPSATTGSPGHIFWVVPAYKVDYLKNFKPLSPREKFAEWARATYDPLGLLFSGIEAGTLQYSSSDGFCGYGHGWAGYGECYGSMQLDSVDSAFIGDFALTVLLHQDPRYFRLGEGSFAKRLWYSITRVFVTINDSGRPVFYTSALSGTVIGAVVSNLYYPKTDRGVSATIDRAGIDLGNTELYNAAAEFWPDIHHAIRKIF